MNRAVQRYASLGLLLAIAAFAAGGYFSIRRGVENLRVIDQDNILWSAAQMEVDLQRLKLSLAELEMRGTPEALADAKARFEVLQSRILAMDSGRAGELIRRYDAGYDAIPALRRHLGDLASVIATLEADDGALIRAIRGDLARFQDDLRRYTLRVVRGDTAATAEVRERIISNSRTTMAISLAAVLLSLFTLGLILRERRRQRQMAELNHRIAAEAARGSRAKSRFLTMMSHELRNPLNGVLGPLALFNQTDMTARQARLIRQAQQSGRSMVRMLAGLLDYGAMQDGGFALCARPFRPAAVAEGVRDDIEAAGAGVVRVSLAPEVPDLVEGDGERLRQAFAHLVEYMLEDAPAVDLAFGYAEGQLIGEIGFAANAGAVDWKLDLMMGLGEMPPDQFSTDALRPLLARGFIAAANGGLTLVEGDGGRRAIRVAVPAADLGAAQVRVRLETRSTALDAIYRAALRSERIVFVADGDAGPVDLILVDASSDAERPVMATLRARFPDALFVALGAPPAREAFDDVVETPADMTRLRSSILGPLAC